MASQASWQTGAPDRDEDVPDRQSLESLLRRLMQQVEETERRYGEALDELQGRLDRLAHKTDAARSTGPGDAATLDRLHDQVSGLARRFEREASTSLDDFERLGRAVMVGLDRGASGSASHPSATPFTSPFAAEPAFTLPSPFVPEPFNAAAPGPRFPPFPPLPDADRDLGKRLVDMAHRLEHSVDAAMAPKALDDLNLRIDAIGRQIVEALAAAPKPFSLEALERQIADIARKLGQAEAELAKIGDIETALHRLIERMDGHEGQLGDVAAKAATEAARLVSGEAKLDAATAARLDVMHRDLKAMGAQSNAADDRIAGIIEAVNDSLKQLVQQVDRSASMATAPRPHASLAERIRAEQGERPHGELANSAESKAEGSKSGQDEDSGTGAGLSPKSGFGPKILGAERSATQAPFGRAKRGQPDHVAPGLDEGASVDVDAPRRSRILVKKVARTQSEMEDDLVAAARRAAQAAALRAAERTGGDKRKWAPSGAQASRVETPRVEMPRVEMPRSEARRVETLRAEAPLWRGRPLLIVCAAVLLALSAILLYSRLQTKPWPELLPPAAEESAPLPSAPSQNGSLPHADEKAPAAEPKRKPPASSPSAVAPDATSNPGGNAGSGTDENVTDIAKSSYWPATVMKETVPPEPAPLVGETPQAEPALQSIEEPALPPGVVFAVEDPSAGY
jgi:hypothetical protein